jgi:hypothetical protein
MSFLQHNHKRQEHQIKFLPHTNEPNGQLNVCGKTNGCNRKWAYYFEKNKQTLAHPSNFFFKSFEW